MNIKELCDKIEALPDHSELYVENNTSKPVEVDCGHDYVGFDTDSLKALVARLVELEPLTRERLSKMSPAEIAALSWEDVKRALSK